MDCDQRTAEGIIHSIGRRGLDVVGVSSMRRCPAWYSSYMNRYFQSPRLSQGFNAYFDFLITLPVRGVLVPSGDLSVQFLALFGSRLIKAGFLLNIVDNDALLQAFDKWKCYQLCISKNVPVAKTIFIESASSILQKTTGFSFPAIIKPTRLAGGIYIRVFSVRDAEKAFETLHDIINHEQYRMHDSGLIFQEWVDSKMEDNWSCDVFYDKHSNFKSAVTIKRIRTSLNENGTPTSRLYAGKIRNNPELIETTRHILESIRWQGPAHVEYIYDRISQKFLLTEINPRLPGYSYLLSQTGYEFGYFYAADLFGLDYTTPARMPETFYFESLRCPGDVTEGLINSFRGFITIRSLFKSYLSAIFSKERMVIEHLNYVDIPMSIAILLNNAVNFIRKMMTYIRKRSSRIYHGQP